jgi:prepilin-type processing-associated H-X9-DG protein
MAPTPVQFRLSTLLLAFVVVAMSLATFGTAGIVVSAVLLAAIAYIRSAESMGRAALQVFCFAVFGSCLIGLLLPFHSHAGPAARRASCGNNLHQIGLALHFYHNAKGSFPPVSVSDKDGKPMHSWRLLILPYMDGAPAHEQYDFAQPWDGPKNKKLVTPSREYTCLCDDTRANATTSYVALTAPNSPWGRSWSATPGKDKNPAMVVEVANSGICWMEPRDLSLHQACAGLNPKSGIGISSKHVLPGEFFRHDAFAGAHVLFADGSVRFVPAGCPPDLLKGVLAGDPERIQDLDMFQATIERRANLPNWSSLAGLVISVAVMLLRPRRSPSREAGQPEQPMRSGAGSNS